MPQKEIVYQGKVFNITRESVVDEDGTKHVIEKCSRPDVVTVIGLQGQMVLLINEFRSGSKKHVYWLPGGKVDDGELPKDAAKREFEEETNHYSSKYELFHMVSKRYVYW
jgi:ADP-ribose pyrophosphatase